MATIFLFFSIFALNNFNENSHTIVYVTSSGKRYFYYQYDKGLRLGHAKKIYKISLHKARAKGFILSATEGGANSTRHSYHRHSIR